MASNLYVVDGEFVTKAAQIRQAARRLSAYAANLSALTQRVHTSRALYSVRMEQALERIARDIREASASLEGVVAGIDDLTAGFVLDMDDIDRYD